MSAPRILDLVVERAVAGGRMLARHDGRIVLVAGAIPGERVRARVTSVSPHVAKADVIEVIEPSPNRRPTTGDPSCGGLDYAHLAPAAQIACKAEIVADAFRRIAKQPLDAPVPVTASPGGGYRLRARLHVRGGRSGFFREGTHEICDAAATGQLQPEAIDAVQSVLAALGLHVSECESVTLAENIAATERIVHLHAQPGAALRAASLALPRAAVVTGVTTARGRRLVTLAGSAVVTDTGVDVFGDAPASLAALRWSRHATSFFQGNRFLVGALVRAVIDAADGRAVADLYAGVGLFSLALAAGGRDVLAVEGDPSGAADLAANATPWTKTVRVVHAPVESVVSRAADRPFDVVVLDPPRTGASSEALRGIVAWRPRRIVYVSCDPPTLARDAARLFAAGYALSRAEAFDLFPNTSHVETVATFLR